MIGTVLKIALRALARNKVRSALTMLGIIIGVASVIAMVSLGQGAQKQVQDQISSMGTNMLIVSAGSQRTGGVRGGAAPARRSRRGRGGDLRELPAVAAVSPSVERVRDAGVRQPELEHASGRRRRQLSGDPQSRDRLGRVLHGVGRSFGGACGGDRADGSRSVVRRRRPGRADDARAQPAVPRGRCA